MGQRPIHRLLLTDNTFFEIKAALSPTKNFCQCSFAFESFVSGVPNFSLVQVNLTVPTAGLKGETPAALAHARHLQNLGGGKLVQTANEGMTWVDPLSRDGGMTVEAS